jgi:hypothetical protein
VYRAHAPTPRPQEDAIAQPYREIDRALKTHKPRSRQVSAAILVVGLLGVLVALWFAPERRRQRTARTLAPGADSTVVLRALGARPTRCPGGGMDHVRAELSGLAETQRDSAMPQLAHGTRARWLYPGRQGCTPAKGETEVGLDSAGRVFWILPAAERGGLLYPASLSY